MHREVFEVVEPPWFVGNVRNPSEVGANEDYNLLFRAKREGFGVWCDTTMRLEHIGSHGITVDEARGYWEARAEREDQDD